LLLLLALLKPLSALSQNPVIPDPDWKVARAQFTTGISDREPVDEVILTGPPVTEMYFFTDLRHLEGRTVSHRWEYEGQLIQVKPFVVEGPRWRVFSKKEILPEQVGEWSVTVLDESGWPLHTELFHYEAGGAGESAPDGGLSDISAGEAIESAVTAPAQIPAEEAEPATPLGADQPAPPQASDMTSE
jgi:hypothetical protein